MRKDIKLFATIALILSTLQITIVFSKVYHSDKDMLVINNYISTYFEEIVFLQLLLVPLLITFLVRVIVFSKQKYNWSLIFTLVLIYGLSFSIGVIIMFMHAMVYVV